MAKAVLSAAHFQCEDAAFAYVEARLWPNGPSCPHCGNADSARIRKLAGKTTRRGLHKCNECSKPFTVRMGTIFESSHLPLHLWLQVMHLMCASKKGISTRQIQRMLNCSMKTAWFLGHRIRLAMDPGSATPIGGAGKTVEVDDTVWTTSQKTRRKPGPKKPKATILSLVERGGAIRSVVLDHRGLRAHLWEHLDTESRLVTDSAQAFKNMVPEHETVDHSKFEWARGDVHVQTLEGFFSVFKRGLIGIYQHVDKAHLPRYTAEFDFRFNHRAKLGIHDAQRAEIALKGAVGKRLMYRGLICGVESLRSSRIVVRLMAEDDRITLIIEGLPEDDGRVRLGAFMSQLQSLSATLTKLDREANDGRAATYLRIAELSYSSPVRVVLEPHALPKQPYFGAAIVEGLGRVVAALENGSDLSGLDADLLEDIRALTRPVGRTVQRAALLFDGHEFDLTPRVTQKVDHALAVEEECDGSIEGMLEQINLHHAANVFYIYPEVGPRKVTCRFPARLFDEAVAAVGKRVEVFGSLKYRSGATYPHEVSVSQVEAFLPESELPDWDDLRGRAPDATGDLSSEAFIRELRDGWR